MSFNNLFLALSQNADAEKPSLFPFPFKMHLVFVIVSVIFFAYRYTQQKRPFQAIMGVAIVLSMALWLSESKSLFYFIGLLELLLIIAAFVTALIFKAPPVDDDADEDEDDSDEADEEEAEEADEESEDGASDDNSDDDVNNGDEPSDDEDDKDAEDEMTVLDAANTVNNLLNN